MSWKVIFSTFMLLFLAELGDKTQLAVITSTANTRNPLSVFIGATLALAVVTLIGVVFGEAITARVPPTVMRVVAGSLFLIFGALILTGKM
jgi:putative Ca2+/H+ antiporter (TMEM165/GDT1 family)